jgi:abortive infection bacteriophage resistance protein
MLDDKPTLTVPQQISLLQSRGMAIADPEEANRFLHNVSYYRLKGYWWADQADDTEHAFRSGVTFENIVDRYNFDRELRLIILNMIERVEVGIRTRMTYELSLVHGPHWFADVTNFHNPKQWSSLLTSIRRDVDRSSEIFIKEHHRKYGRTDSRLPPAWKTMEILTLGTLSKLYATLDNNLPEKIGIARSLGLGQYRILENWLQLITILRNVCAHHSRIYGRPLPLQLATLRRPRRNWVDDRTLDRATAYATVCACKYLLETISSGNRFTFRLDDLFTTHASVDPGRLGFPANWKSQPLWR